MSFTYRYRKPTSLVALTALIVASTITPVAADYHPDLGRFIQRDPNGTGLVLTPGLRFHGDNPVVTVSMAYELQFGDGMNFYEYLRSNAFKNTDPSGLSVDGAFEGYNDLTMDWFAESGAVEDNLTGQKLYVLGQLNEKARWASLGLQTAADIGLSLIPGYGLYEASQSIDIIKSGRGGFFDYMTVGLAGISTVGAAVKAIKLLTKARLWSARAKRGARFAGAARPFTKRNFRHNLMVRTRVDPGTAVHAHHVLPHEHLSEFAARGINVNDPKYAAWWTGGPHLRAHRAGYNDRWRRLFDRNPTVGEIHQFGRTLAKEFGFEIGF